MALAGRLLLHVVIWREQQVVAREDHVGRHIVVGCDPTRADLLVVDDDAIAAEHALVEHDGERVTVHALSENHALYVNGSAMRRAHVRPADEVQIGAHVLRMCVLHAATAQRWQQTLAHDDLALAPTTRPTVASNADDAPVAPTSSPAPEWLLPHVPEATRLALLAPLPCDAAAMLQAARKSSTRAGYGLALLKVGHALEDFRLVRRHHVVPKSYRTVGRYDEPREVPSPLRLSRVGRAEAAAWVPSGLAWVVHRKDGIYDEQAGVRENWAYRGRSHVRIKLTHEDELHVRVEPTTYVARLLPMPEAPVRTRVTWQSVPWRTWMGAWQPWLAGALAVLLLGLGVAGGLARRARLQRGHPATLAKPLRRAPAIWAAHLSPETGPLAAPGGPAAAGGAPNAASPVTPAIPWPAGIPNQVGHVGVPGGSHGYRLFGMLLPEAVVDPNQLPGAPSAAAPDRWLAGTEQAWDKVLKSAVGGAPWLLDCDARDVQVSDAKVAPAQVAQWLVSHAEPWLACYEKGRPKKEKARVGVTWTMAADGRVRSLRSLAGAAAGPGDAAWLSCLNGAKGAWRGPRFSGSEVTVRAVVTLWPWSS